MIELKRTDVKNLDVFANPYDLRRDLHAFSRYVSYSEIKRAHRDNSLPKTHLKRIAKMMSDASLISDVDEDGGSPWIDFVDRLSLKLGFVDYETEGQYMGYSSYTQSYPDNYIQFLNDTYESLMGESLQEQEDEILRTLANDAAPCKNEFFTIGPLSRLDRFDSFGCATGVMNHIRFPQARMHLLQLLADCRPGVWYSTASLIEHLKNSNPFFLIPKKLPLERDEYRKDRYHNFAERKPGHGWGESWAVGHKEDSFERVEGRFVERFLEGIPLSMGYVEAAYSKESADVYPSMGRLSAFRVTDLLPCAMNGSIKEPEIRVLPNHEIHVDSMFYPAKAMERLLDFCDVVTEGIHAILRLVKKKVIGLLAVEELDVAGLLRDLSGQEVPANIQEEIASWSERADDFVVYQGFGLLEGRVGKELADRFVSQAVAPDVNIVREPKKLYRHLEKAGEIPFYAEHSGSALRSLPGTIRSRFAGKKRRSKRRRRKTEKLTLRRTVHTILEFPDKELYEAFTGALSGNGSALETNNQTRTVSYTKEGEKTAMDILDSLKTKYSTVIQDI